MRNFELMFDVSDESSRYTALNRARMNSSSDARAV